MNVNQRALLQTSSECAPQCRTCSVAECSIVATQRLWKIFERVRELSGNTIQLSVVGIEQAWSADPWLTPQPAIRVNSKASQHNSIEQHPAPRGHHATTDRRQAIAIDNQLVYRRAVGHRSTIVRQAENVAILQHDRLCTSLACQCRMGGQMPPFAMRWHGITGLHQPVQPT